MVKSNERAEEAAMKTAKDLKSKGYSNAIIAEKMVVTESTVQALVK